MYFLKDINIERFKLISKKISKRRKELGYTQEKFCEIVGLSYSYYTKIEAPNTIVPFSMETLFDIADSLGLEPKDLL